MSHTNRNFVLAYAFLVILPLVGLAGILKSGHKLVAPVAIDGTWSVQIDSAQLDSLPCGKIFGPGDKTFAISQSGRSLVLSFPNDTKSTASGTLDGTTLRASLISQPGLPSDSNCGPLSILASVNGTPDSRSLLGAVSAANCPTCASVGFRADRQARVSAKGGH
jgi:hypothetical protein